LEIQDGDEGGRLRDCATSRRALLVRDRGEGKAG